MVLMVNLALTSVFVPILSFVILMLYSAWCYFGNKTPKHIVSAVMGAGSMGISSLSAIITAILFFIDGSHTKESNATWLEFEVKDAGMESSYTFIVEIGVLLDGLSVIGFALISTIAFIIHFYAVEYMKDDEGHVRFFAIMNLFSASMLFFVLAPNFLQAFVFWEMLGITSYFLIGFWWKDKHNSFCGRKAFMYNRIGDVMLMAGFILIFQEFKTFNFIELSGHFDELSPGKLAIIGFLIFGGAIGKSAQFPLSGWLPDAMSGPTPVSALLHSSTMVKAGIFLVARTFWIYFGGHTDSHGSVHLVDLSSNAAISGATIVAVVAGFTALYAATQALVSTDIKQILAYSTVSQLAYMAMSIGLGGLTAATYHIISHATFKALLFLCAGAIIHAMHSHDDPDFNAQDIRNMGGLWHKMKWTKWPTVIAALALAGFPFTSGFWSKDAILLTAWESPLEVGKPLFYVASFTALLTAFYSARMVFLVFFTKPRYGKKAHPHEAHWIMWLPLVVLGTFVVLETLLFQPIFGFEGWLHDVLHHNFVTGDAHELSWGIAGASMVISLLGIGGAYAFYQWKGLTLEDIRDVKIIGPIASGTTKFFENRWYVDAIIYKLTEWVIKYVGGVANWFETQILDEQTYSNVIPKGTLSVAGFTTFKIERGIDITLDQIAEKTNKSGKWLRRIQSGITQDYMSLIVTTLAIFLSYVSLQKFGLI